jgi:glucan 1,3-beta-glucosidase
MRHALAPRPVWVAETGWPAAGRPRGPAEASPQAQARFVRELLHREAREALGFNLIEAFDQPWKRALEGPMGGAWGLLDAEGRLRVPMQGDAPPDPRARWVVGSAAVGGVLGLGVALAIGLAAGGGPARGWGHRDRNPSDRSAAATGMGLGRAGAVLALALASALLALLASVQLQTLADGVRVGSDRPVLALAGVLSALVGCLGAWALARTLDGAPLRWNPAAQRLAGAFLFVAATLVLWSVFDGRYRALPGVFLAGPAVLALALLALGLRWPHDGATAAAGRALAAVLGAAAMVLPFVDGLATGQVLATALAGAALAAAALWPTAAEAGREPAFRPEFEPAPAGRRGAEPSGPVEDPDAAGR